MIYDDFKKLRLGNKNIAIIGNSNSGKSTTARLLHNNNRSHTLFGSDDYMGLDFAKVPDYILRDIRANKAPFILEGQQAPRILRRIKKDKLPIKIDMIVRLHHVEERSDTQLAINNQKIIRELDLPVLEVVRTGKNEDSAELF